MLGIRGGTGTTGATGALRRYLIAAVACGVVIAGCTIASAVVLAHIVAGIITNPATALGGETDWAPGLVALAVLWSVRVVAQWFQGRLSQRGATAVIGELSRQVLSSVTTSSPRRLAADRDSAAAVVTRGWTVCARISRATCPPWCSPGSSRPQRSW